MSMKRSVFCVLLVGLVGCGPKYIQSSLPHELEKHSVQDVGLIPFVVEPSTTGEIRSGKVEDDGAQIITDQFYRKLIELHVKVVRWEGQQPLPSGDGTPLSDLQRAEQIGKILKTSTVLFGSVTAYTERDGTAYSISRPASVGVKVQLIHAEDGHLLWKASYNETQKSLFEDISAYSLFFKRGWRWLTASELSEDAVEQLIAASPWTQRKTN
ncbi:MAG TPA: hypothetical protein VMN77_05980 [Nitrospiria bacterium]|jgi:hypothetical protein|nr:hypothetical protein [Nitrospiria bacterium]